MKIKYSFLLTVLLAGSNSLPVWSQLPPTRMGQFVQQPGDNQYSVETQNQRHGGSYFDTNGGPHVMVGPNGGGARGASAGGGGSSSGRSLAPPPPKGPDISIEPITADEPIAPTGFPPMPIAFDLPVGPGLGASAGGSWKEGAAGSAAGSGPTTQGMHQHYAHYQPGAFQPGGSTVTPPPGPPVDVAPAIGGASGASGAGGSSYYKVRTPPPPMRVTEHYNVNSSGGGPPPPGYSGAGTKDLKALGKAPALDTKQDAGAPEAPSPVLINQTTTQDLSLPDDQFTSRYFQNGKGTRYVKQAVRRGRNFGRQMLRTTGVPF